MKTSRHLATFLVIMLICMLFAACGSKNSPAASDEGSDIYGSWAYIHDKETAVVVFRKDGTALYEGKEYSFEYDHEFIKLTDAFDKKLQLRYAFKKDGMYLYSNTEYTYDGGGAPVDLVGEWVCEEKNWSYAFTDKGSFMEDGYFPGHYIVDEENSTFKLVYNDQFEDTVCFYKLEGDKLYIEYPWSVVKINIK